MIPTHSVKEIQRLFVYLRSLEVSVSVCINNNAKILSAQITDEAQTHADFNTFSSGYSSAIIRSHDEKHAELGCHLFYKVLVQLCQQRTRLICWTLCMLQPTEHLSLGITVQSTKLHPFSFIPQTSSLDHGVFQAQPGRPTFGPGQEEALYRRVTDPRQRLLCQT